MANDRARVGLGRRGHALHRGARGRWRSQGQGTTESIHRISGATLLCGIQGAVKLGAHPAGPLDIKVAEHRRSGVESRAPLDEAATEHLRFLEVKEGVAEGRDAHPR